MFAKKATAISALAAMMVLTALVPTAQATTRALTDNLLNATEPNFDCNGGTTAWTNVPAGFCSSAGLTGFADAGGDCTSGNGGTCLDAAYFNYYVVIVMSDPNDELTDAADLRFLYPGLADFAGAYGTWDDCNGNGFVDDVSIADGGSSTLCGANGDEFDPISFCDSYNYLTCTGDMLYFEIAHEFTTGPLVQCGGAGQPPCPPSVGGVVDTVVDLGNPVWDHAITCGAGDFADRTQSGDDSATNGCLVANGVELPNYPVPNPGLAGLEPTWVPDDNNVDPTETVTCVATYTQAGGPDGTGCEQLGDQWADHVEYVNTNLPDYLDTPARIIAKSATIAGTPPLAYFDYCPTGTATDPQRCGYNGVDSISIHTLIAFPAGSFVDGVVTAVYNSAQNPLDNAGRQTSDSGTTAGAWSTTTGFEDFDYFNAA